MIATPLPRSASIISKSVYFSASIQNDSSPEVSFYTVNRFKPIRLRDTQPQTNKQVLLIKQPIKNMYKVKI